MTTAEALRDLFDQWEKPDVFMFAPNRVHLDALLAGASALERVEKLETLVSRQAEDEGIWFIAKTAPEAYLQQELRKLHAAVEGAALAPAKEGGGNG